MHYYRLKRYETEPIEFINYWSKLYNEGKYSDTEYKTNLNIKGELIKENVENLYTWKNGRPLKINPKLKPSMNRALDNIDKINKFRKIAEVINDDIDYYNEFAKSIFRAGIIYRIFLFHIARPLEFPIFDQFVFRAYKYMSSGELISRNPYNKDFRLYLNEYRPFFHKIADECRIDRRNIDKIKIIDNALMEFGRFITNYGDLL